MADNVDIKLLAGLNLTTSEQQLIDDIKALQKRIEAAGYGKIKLTAEFDQNLAKVIKDMRQSKDIASAGKDIGQALANNLINGFNIKNKDAQNQIKGLVKSLYTMSVGEFKTGADNPAYLQTFDKLGDIVLKNANIIQSRMGIYDDFYKYFQGLSKIKIPDIVRQDLGKDWDTMRRTAASKFVTDKSGIDLDSIYQEMSGKYKDIFSGTADQTQQFREIINAVKAYRADIDKLTPVDPAKITGFEDDMWQQLVAGIGKMREQIKAHLPEISADVEQTATKIKQSLLNIDVSFANGDVEQLTGEVKAYFSALSGLSDKNIKLQFFKDAEENVTSFNATLDKGQGIIEKYRFTINDLGQFVYDGGNLIDQSGKDYAEATAKAAQYQQKLEALKTTYKSFLTGTADNNPFKAMVDSINFNGITDKGSLDAMISKFEQAEARAKALNSELNKKWSSSASEKLEQYLKDLPQDIEYLESKFKGADFKIPDNIQQSFAQMRQVLIQINQTDDPTKKIALYNQLTGTLNEVTKQYRQLNQEKKNATKDEAVNLQREKLSTSIQMWSNQNTAAARMFSSEISEIQSKIQSADKSSLTNLERQFANVQQKAKELGLTTNSVTNEIKDGFDRAVARVVSLTAAFRTFRRMISTARELDTSLFNLQVATGNTREQTKALLDTYNQMARELGATTPDIANAADAWLRQGKSIEESNMLIKDSMILSKIGMIDSAQATEYLTSTLNGYQLQASSALEIISKLSAVDLESASDAGGIAAAMSRTATSAKQAGIDINELIGIIATLKDVTQANDEEIGNSVKSIVSRYSQVKANKFVDYETGEDLSNVEVTLKKVGIQIRSSLGDYRDLTDVLTELAGKWGTLNDTERNAVSTSLFGTYQAEKGKVLMANYDKVQALTEVSAQSSTEALDKFAAYGDTLEAHINSLTAAYENIASKAANSEFLKGTADGGAVFLDIISQTIDKLGVLSTAIGAVTAGAALKGKTLGAFSNNGTTITFLGKTVEEIKAASAAGEKFGGVFTSKVVQPMSGAEDIIARYNSLVDQQCVSQQNINALTDDFNMRKYLSGLNGARAGMQSYTASLNMGTAATIGLKVATVALNMALNMAVVGAITAGVSYLTNKYHELNPTVEEVSQALSEQQRVLDEQSDKVASVAKELETAKARMEELQQLGGTGTLVDDQELQKLKDVTVEKEAQLAIEKERLALAARETLKTANKSYNTFDAEYDINGNKWSPNPDTMWYADASGSVLSDNPVSELENTVEAYKKTYDEYMKVTKKIASGEGDVSKLTAQQDKLSKSLMDIRQHASDTYKIISDVNDAYRDISRSGQKLTAVEQEQYTQTARGVTIYNEFLSSINEQEQATGQATNSLDDYTDAASAATEAQEDLNAALKAIPAGNQIANVNELYTGFEKLDKIMADVKDKGTFDYSNLADTDFTKTFGGLENYADFIKTVSTYPDDLGKCQAATNALVTEWLNSSKSIKEVDASTADLTARMLENMGVVNADQVVQDALIKKTYETAIANIDLSKSVDENCQAFREEMSVFDLTETELDNLTVAYANAQNTMTSALSEGVDGRLNILASELEAVKSVADAYNLIAGKIAESAANTGDTSAEAQRNLATNMKLNPGLNAQVQAVIDYGKAIEDTQAVIDKARGAKGNAVYGGGIKTNKGGSGSGSSSEKEFDWIERRTKLLEDKRASLVNQSNNSFLKYLGLSESDISNAKKLVQTTSAAIGNNIAAVVSAIDANQGAEKNDIFAAIQNQMRLLGIGKVVPAETVNELQELSVMADTAGLSLAQLMDLLKNGDQDSRQSALAGILEMDKELLANYDDNVKNYAKEYAEAVTKIPSEIKDKIENGGIDVETFSGKEAKNIQKAIDAYDNLMESEKKREEQRQTYANDIKSFYENDIKALDAENQELVNSNALISAQIGYIEESGGIVNAMSYETIIANLQQQESVLERKIRVRKAELQELLDSGELDENSEEYENLRDIIDECESSMVDLKKQQEEYNNKLLQMPVKNMEIVISMYGDITTAIQNWGAEQESAGKKLDASYYQALIANGSKVIDELQEQADLIQDVMGEYERGSDNWNDLYSQLQSVNTEMSSMVQNLQKWNEELLQMPIDNIATYTDDLNKVLTALNSVKSDHETVINAVVAAIDDEIARLNDEKEVYEKNVNDEIDILQDKLDLYNKQNEALKLQRDYEQALYDLQVATTQKTEAVIRNGEKVYETNADNIRNAQSSVTDALEALKENEIQTQIDDLNDALDAYNDKLEDQIDALEKIKEKWSEIATEREKADNAALATEILGNGWQNKVITGNDNDIYTMFKNLYNSNIDQINQYQDQITSTENIESLIQDYITSYKEGTISYQEAQAGIQNLLSQMNEKMTSDENLQNVYDYLGTVHDTDANGNAILEGIQKSLDKTSDELLDAFEQYNENIAMIGEYTTSWEQLTNNVDEMRDLLEEVRDNLEDALDAASDRDDNDDGGSSGHWLSGDSGNGPGVHAKGILAGKVGGDSNTEKDKMIKYLTTHELDPGQIPIIADKGEYVVNPEQQELLLENYGRAMSNLTVKLLTPSIDYSKFGTTAKNQDINVNFEKGSIVLNEVQNVDEFAKAMDKNFALKMGQLLSKYDRFH